MLCFLYLGAVRLRTLAGRVCLLTRGPLARATSSSLGRLLGKLRLKLSLERIDLRFVLGEICTIFEHALELFVLKWSFLFAIPVLTAW